jgi:hypothetical protein
VYLGYSNKQLAVGWVRIDEVTPDGSSETEILIGQVQIKADLLCHGPVRRYDLRFPKCTPGGTYIPIAVKRPRLAQIGFDGRWVGARGGLIMECRDLPKPPGFVESCRYQAKPKVGVIFGRAAKEGLIADFCSAGEVTLFHQKLQESDSYCMVGFVLTVEFGCLKKISRHEVVSLDELLKFQPQQIVGHTVRVWEDAVECLHNEAHHVGNPTLTFHSPYTKCVQINIRLVP